jgi:HPt (histidine-containing phosphotransfer) domain-containing protein
LPAGLVVLSLASFALSIWLMKSGHSATAFFMSPPRAWEFLVGGIIAVEGFPALRRVVARQIARCVALLVLAIPIFSLRQGPGFPGFDALAPCIGAALFIWSGVGVSTMPRSPLAPLGIAAFFGRISYSLYLWHWPLFTFARFSKNGLVLDPVDKLALFAVTVAISYLSWRYVEQPFRDRTIARTRAAAFRIAGATSVALLAAGVLGLFVSRAPSEADRVAQQLAAYDAYDIKALYRSGTCFVPETGVFNGSCLTVTPGKPNWLLWGDSFAAHYFHGLHEVAAPRGVNVLQATQAACMPTLDAAAQGRVACRNFAAQLQGFFRDHRVDLVIMAGDWLEYARGSRFDGMIAELKHTISALNGQGIAVALLGPSVQFKARLPSMLLRAHLRGAEIRPNDFVLPDIFSFDHQMKAALPQSEKFSFISVVDAVCPQRQCPLTVEGGVPLAWDHAHLTAQGSVFVLQRLTPMLDHER